MHQPLPVSDQISKKNVCKILIAGTFFLVNLTYFIDIDE